MDELNNISLSAPQPSQDNPVLRKKSYLILAIIIQIALFLLEIWVGREAVVGSDNQGFLIFYILLIPIIPTILIGISYFQYFNPVKKGVQYLVLGILSTIILIYLGATIGNRLGQKNFTNEKAIYTAKIEQIMAKDKVKSAIVENNLDSSFNIDMSENVMCSDLWDEPIFKNTYENCFELKASSDNKYLAIVQEKDESSYMNYIEIFHQGSTEYITIDIAKLDQNLHSSYKILSFDNDMIAFKVSLNMRGSRYAEYVSSYYNVKYNLSTKSIISINKENP